MSAEQAEMSGLNVDTLAAMCVHWECCSTNCSPARHRSAKANSSVQVLMSNVGSDVALAESVLALYSGDYVLAIKLAGVTENADTAHALVECLDGCVSAIRCDREAALEAFERCVAEGGYGSTDDVLARALLFYTE